VSLRRFSTVLPERGNGSEGCDPGNSSTSASGSSGQNMGGEEGGPISGGTGVN